MRIPQKSLDLIRTRSLDRCEVCHAAATQTQHRKPRGMGGSPDPSLGMPSNLLRVCGWAGSASGCHHEMETNRTHAYDMGWLVHRHLNPADVPVLLLGPGWVLLTDSGRYLPTERSVA